MILSSHLKIFFMQWREMGIEMLQLTIIQHNIISHGTFVHAAFVRQ